MQDEVRIKITDALVEKLYNMALIPTKKSLVQCERLAVSAFCRRRLPVVLVRLKFCETMREAVTFVEQGHIRIGERLDAWFDRIHCVSTLVQSSKIFISV